MRACTLTVGLQDTHAADCSAVVAATTFLWAPVEVGFTSSMLTGPAHVRR